MKLNQFLSFVVPYHHMFVYNTDVRSLQQEKYLFHKIDSLQSLRFYQGKENFTVQLESWSNTSIRWKKKRRKADINKILDALKLATTTMPHTAQKTDGYGLIMRQQFLCDVTRQKKNPLATRQIVVPLYITK